MTTPASQPSALASAVRLTTRPAGTVMIYGCGGGGTNLAKEYVTDGHSADLAKISVAFLDTSDSNLEDEIAQRAFLFSNPDGTTDGSGSIRAANAELIASQLPKALTKYPAQEMNIIVSTASGGTGNVIAYELANHMMANKQRFVMILVGTAEDERKAKNTIQTLASLQNLVEEYATPLIFHWGFNEPGKPRSGVDKEAHLMIHALCVLASRRNHGLDNSDLGSFLNYTLPRPDIQPSLARIRVFDNVSGFDQAIEEPISVAYLRRSADDAIPAGFAPYSCDGFLPELAMKERDGLFFGIETKSLHGIQKELEALRKRLADQEASRTAAPSFNSAPEKRKLVLD